MFLRVSTFEHEAERQVEIEKWMHSITDEVRAIEGLRSVEVFPSTPEEGVIVAVYDDEAAFEAAAGTVRRLLGDLGQYLTGPIVTMAGTAFWSVRE